MKRGLFLIMIYILIFRQQQKDKAFFESGKNYKVERANSQSAFISSKSLATANKDSSFRNGSKVYLLNNLYYIVPMPDRYQRPLKPYLVSQ